MSKQIKNSENRVFSPKTPTHPKFKGEVGVVSGEIGVVLGGNGVVLGGFGVFRGIKVC
jgi:hypothetical protein